MKINDNVQVIDLRDPDYGMVGTIVNNWMRHDLIVEFEDNGINRVESFSVNQLWKLDEGMTYPVPRKNPLPIRIRKFTTTPSIHGSEIYVPDGQWNIGLPSILWDHKTKCNHNFVKDSYFSANEYWTCSKCQARKEDVDEEMPF